MTENDLKQLKELPVPRPPKARGQAAVAAALAAFESPRSLTPAHPKGVPFRHV